MRHRARRPSFLTSLALAAAMALVAAPSAQAAKPSRFVFYPTEGFEAGPGEICAFAVKGDPSPGAHQLITDFSDGHEQIIGHGGPILTNLETGKSVDIKARFQAVITVDAATNTGVFAANGRIVYFYGPGNAGPFGTHDGTDGLFLIVGESRATFDLTTGYNTRFEWTGAYENLCQTLAA